MRKTIYPIIAVAFIAGSVFAGANPAAADVDLSVAPVGGNSTTWSAECAAGLLAGLVAALTSGSSAAVGCPT
ncbi:hypothetical protein [Nocardia iowensis]|uniref:Secreted protein n=1 Tax=Nocardia iowensis TaxID=204891 RepID=A0ABX8RKA9_NOCIO|nr:hypothetical protein [Nocardia iowensis]QXN90078.1 hypothetical protein KV110_32320 [Nocardia iowensis]